MGSYQQFKYKKHFIRKNVFMRKHMFLNITVVVALMLAISFCMACSGGQADNHEKIDYTVVENEDLPIELKDPTKEGYEFVKWTLDGIKEANRQ